MIVSLEEAKEWLRVDGNDDDITITVLIGAAENRLKVGTGIAYDDTNDLAKLFCLKCVTDWYENRLPTNVIDQVAISIITMLTYGSGSVVE
jgi:uncharacterized phage protein (predicted DNA packaging)